MRIVPIIQARMGSSRLHGKILSKIEDITMLEHIYRRVSYCKNIDDIIVATTTLVEDNLVEELAIRNGYKYYRGSENNLVNRYYNAAKTFGADVIIRITADCPLITPELIDKNIEFFLSSDCDILSYRSEDGLTRGLDNEIFSFKTIEHLNSKVTDLSELEHVTLHLYNNSDIYKVLSPQTEDIYLRPYRLTVDEDADLELIKKIYSALYKKGTIIDYKDVVKLLDSREDFRQINSHIKQKQV